MLKLKLNSNIEKLLKDFELFNWNSQVGFWKKIVLNTRSKIEEHKLFVMDKSIHKKNLSQALQTNNKQFKTADTFLTGYNGIFNVTNENNEF